MKHKKLLLVFSILFVLSCSLIAVSASDLNDTDVIANDDAGEEIVSSEADIENDITTEPDSGTIYGNTFTDLNNIVAEGGNVNLTRDYTYNESTDGWLYNQGVVIDQDNVVIDGNGKRINGEQQSRVFHIKNANNVTLKNIVFSNSGYSKLKVDGGALYIEESSNITIFNCSFVYNRIVNDGGNGGAIYVKSTDPIRIIDSDFKGNSAGYGGAITAHNATLILENTTFDGNSAQKIGGAINAAHSTQIINNCTFKDGNIDSGSGSDRRRGGAIYAQQFDEDDKMVITNTEFKNNTVYNDGGAVYINGQAKVLIEDSKFSENSAGYGGAIVCDIANVTIMNTEFNENHGREGGAVQAGPSTLIEDCNFTGNYASYSQGGAIFVYQSDAENANATVKNCNFLNNSAQRGGAIFNQETVTILNCNFKDNNASEGYGGAISSQSGKALIYNSNFIGNNASEWGGAIFTFDSDIEIDNSHFIENSAVAGGAISAPSNRKALINNSDFSQNTALRFGGAIVVIGEFGDSEITVENSIFAQNTDTEGTGDIALQNENSKATLINVTPSNLVPKYIVGMEVEEVSDVNYTQTVNLKAFNIKRFGQPLNNGTVVFSINGKNISASVQNGIATLPVFLGAGSYKVDVTYVGDAENANPTKTIEFNVLKLPAVLEVINVTNCTYGDSIQIKANVTSNGSALNEGRIFIIVNGKKYSADVTNGTATINAPMIDAGVYSVNVTYEGNYLADNVSAKFEVSMSTAVMTAKNIAYIINYGGKYSAVLKDINGKAVVGENVTFTLNGKSIGSAVTDNNGVASIQLTPAILKAAKAGNKILVIKLVSSNYKPLSKTVKVTINKEKTKILKAKKTYKFKKSKKAKNIKVTLKNSKNKVMKKVKVTIKLSGKKIKGKKTVTAKTNKKGVVTFKLGKKLTKKTKVKYTITFKGNAYYNKVVKKGKIIVK